MENWISVRAVESVYRRVLAGESLDNIETPDEIKHIIREFMKWASLPGSQIALKSDVPLEVALALRALNRRFKIKQSRVRVSGVIRSADVTFAVKRLLRGHLTASIRSYGVGDDAIKIARRCIKALESGGGTRELYKLGVSHTEAVKLLEFIEAHHLIAKPVINS